MAFLSSFMVGWQRSAQLNLENQIESRFQRQTTLKNPKIPSRD
ncbi:hypothetical protein CKA32_000711 [Geitlerinema sp. FC II]|nr:hypothetical protein CKA32_000711 [Geitlerinema sp. FC II]